MPICFVVLFERSTLIHFFYSKVVPVFKTKMYFLLKTERWILFLASHIPMWGPCTACQNPISGPIFLSQELPLANSSQWVLEIIHHVYVRLDWFIRSCLDMIMIAMPCSKDQTRQHSSPSPGSNILSAFPSTIFPEAWVGASWGIKGMAYWGWALSLFLSVLWKSCITPLTATYCKKELLWPRWRVAHIYAYKHKCLAGALMP